MGELINKLILSSVQDSEDVNELMAIVEAWMEGFMLSNI